MGGESLFPFLWGMTEGGWALDDQVGLKGAAMHLQYESVVTPRKLVARTEESSPSPPGSVANYAKLSSGWKREDGSSPGQSPTSRRQQDEVCNSKKHIGTLSLPGEASICGSHALGVRKVDEKALWEPRYRRGGARCVSTCQLSYKEPRSGPL